MNLIGNRRAISSVLSVLKLSTTKISLAHPATVCRHNAIFASSLNVITKTDIGIDSGGEFRLRCAAMFDSISNRQIFRVPKIASSFGESLWRKTRGAGDYRFHLSQQSN